MKDRSEAKTIEIKTVTSPRTITLRFTRISAGEQACGESGVWCSAPVVCEAPRRKRTGYALDLAQARAMARNEAANS